MALNAFRRITLKEVGNLEKRCQGQRTESYQNIPNVYREPAILSGYRIPGNFWLHYVVSVFHFHNETINIWTHIIATLIYVKKILHLLPESVAMQDHCGGLPLFAFCICAAANSLLSALAHTFHSMSPFSHYICFQLDYAGVGFYAMGQCILFMYISCPNDIYKYISMASLPMNVCLSLVVMFGLSLSKLLYRRPYPFKRRLIQLGSGCIHATFSCIPLIARLAYCISNNEQSCRNTHHIPWIVSMCVCLFFFSSHLPEKIAPGKFDFIGQGHQLFHVFQTLTVLLQFRAAQEDLKNNVDSIWSCHLVSGHNLFLAMLFYILGCLVIIFLLVKYVRKRIDEDKKFS